MPGLVAPASQVLQAMKKRKGEIGGEGGMDADAGEALQ